LITSLSFHPPSTLPDQSSRRSRFSFIRCWPFSSGATKTEGPLGSMQSSCQDTKHVWKMVWKMPDIIFSYFFPLGYEKCLKPHETTKPFNQLTLEIYENRHPFSSDEAVKSDSPCEFNI
jgi:hypothetical protein